MEESESENESDYSHWIKLLLNKVMSYVKPNPKKKEVKYRIPDLNLPPPPPDNYCEESSSSPHWFRAWLNMVITYIKPNPNPNPNKKKKKGEPAQYLQTCP